jgi:hypothetical protein
LAFELYSLKYFSSCNRQPSMENFKKFFRKTIKILSLKDHSQKEKFIHANYAYYIGE